MMGKSLKEVIHETAQDFNEAGVMGEQTMHEFDALCLLAILRANSCHDCMAKIMWIRQ